MSSSDAAGPSENGPTILIIHAPGCPPDQAAVSRLLAAAGLNPENVTFATPAEIVDDSINPKNFEFVFALLGDELEADDQLEAGVLGVAQCGKAITGIWGEGTSSDEMHPALQKYGAKQIPWDAEQLASAIDSEAPQTFKSPTGGQSARHKPTHNTC